MVSICVRSSYSVHQETYDRQQSDLEDLLVKQQQEAESVRDELSCANAELQRQLQLLQIQCERVAILRSLFLVILVWLTLNKPAPG